MKFLATTLAAFVLLGAAGAAGAQDLKTLTAHYKAVIEDGNQQMEYGESNANSHDNYSACINASNAAEDYRQALYDLMAMQDIGRSMPGISDDDRQAFMNANAEAQDDVIDRLHGAQSSAESVCNA